MQPAKIERLHKSENTCKYINSSAHGKRRKAEQLLLLADVIKAIETMQQTKIFRQCIKNLTKTQLVGKLLNNKLLLSSAVVYMQVKLYVAVSKIIGYAVLVIARF